VFVADTSGRSGEEQGKAVIEAVLRQGSFLRTREACMTVPDFTEGPVVRAAADLVVWVAGDNMLPPWNLMTGDARRRETLSI
jgi:hypothetical protein